jgi:uncharacterized protein
LEAARKAAEFCLTVLRPNKGLLRRYARGEAAQPAFLDDYAYLADGLLDLYEATGETHWTVEAQSLAEVLLTKFWDAEDGAFFFAGQDHEALIARSKDLFDGALPSANGVATRVLIRLGALPGSESDRLKAEELLQTYRGMMHRAPNGTYTLLDAALDLFGDSGDRAAQPSNTITEPVRLHSDNNALTLRRGTSAAIHFSLTIAAGFHINARQTGHEHLIPTTITFATDAPASVGPIHYPPHETIISAGESLNVYTGEVVFQLPVTVSADAVPGAYRVTVKAHVQPCTDNECHMPQELTIELPIGIGAE